MLHYNRLKTAKTFLLPGGFGTLTRWKCAPLGMRHKKRPYQIAFTQFSKTFLSFSHI